MVQDHNTVVSFGNSVRTPGGPYPLYPSDSFITSCDTDKNKTFPSGTNPNYTCPDGGGVISYTLCTDGCRYVEDNKINLTFPEKMVHKDLLPRGEKVTNSAARLIRPWVITWAYDLTRDQPIVKLKVVDQKSCQDIRYQLNSFKVN